MPKTNRLSIAIALAGLCLSSWTCKFAQARPRTLAEVIQGIERGGKVAALMNRLGADKIDSLALICIKDKRALELWVNGKLLKTYALTAFSGRLGPKRKQGDLQIPEGIYRAALLNPNSSYHLSIKVGYPNKWDRDWAASEGRGDLGGDIYIHGDNVSVGCLAIGDESIEEVFYLVHRAGLPRVRIIISPFDFRGRPYKIAADAKVLELYETIKEALKAYQA